MRQSGFISTFLILLVGLITFIGTFYLASTQGQKFIQKAQNSGVLAVETSQSLPIGYIDHVSSPECIVSGWVKDNDSPQSSTSVDIYKGPKEKAGTFMGRTNNLTKRSDNLLGFDYILPTNFNGDIYVYARDIDIKGNYTETFTNLPLYSTQQYPNKRSLNCSGEQPPQGFIDHISATDCMISGWSLDPNSTKKLKIHLYKGQPPASGGTFITAIDANNTRGDGLPGFHYTLPAGFNDNIYAVAIGINSQGINDNSYNSLPIYWDSVSSRKVSCTNKPVILSQNTTASTCNTNGIKTASFLTDEIAQWTYDYPQSTKITSITLPANPAVRFEVSTPSGESHGGQYNQPLIVPLNTGESKIYITAYMNACTAFTQQFQMHFNCGMDANDFIGLGSNACQSNPIGYVDNNNGGTCQISGWATDNNLPSTDLDIQVYKDAEKNQGGELIAQGKTNSPRLDVPGAKGYTISLPSGFSGSLYTYAQGINSGGQKDGRDGLLSLYTPGGVNRTLNCAPALSPGESAQSLDLKNQLGFKVNLGAIEPVIGKNEWGITGATPDGYIAVKRIGSTTKTFFSCFNNVGSSSDSCLSENGSIDSFNGLNGLYHDSSKYISVLSPGNPSLLFNGRAYESKYASLTSVWDDGNGTLHGWYHAEEYLDSQRTQCPYSHYGTVGYAISTDGGKNFVKQTPVIESNFPKQIQPGCNSQGISHPRIIESNDYLYMFYDWWTPNYSDGGVSIARTVKTNPRNWKKYYLGSFTEPGIDGNTSPVIKIGDNNQNLWSPYVIWSSKINKFIMLHTDFNNEGAIYIRTSPDLITWSSPALLFTDSTFDYRYPSLIGIDDKSIGDTGWIYFARTQRNANLGPDSLLARRKINFSF